MFDWLADELAAKYGIPKKIGDAWLRQSRLTAFLDGLVRSNQRPDAVVLDVEFDPCQSTPCGAPMESAREALASSIRRAAQRFPIYATEEPKVGRDDVVAGVIAVRDDRAFGAMPAPNIVALCWAGELRAKAARPWSATRRQLPGRFRRS